MSEKNKLFFTKIGIPYSLRWGYLGMILFMIGDGLEQGWLSPYLVERGLSVTQSAQLFAAYGLAVGIAAWVSGVLAQIWGIRRVMWAGFIMFTISSIPFIALGVSNLNYPVMLVTYVLRGVGYPLFAYSFIVWITYRAEQKILARVRRMVLVRIYMRIKCCRAILFLYSDTYYRSYLCIIHRYLLCFDRSHYRTCANKR